MDTITQAALGACIAQAGFRGKLGGKAVAVGALCGIIPDLDFLLSIGRGEFGTLVVHRGWSHSLLVLPLLAAPLAWLMMKWATRGLPPPDQPPLAGAPPTPSKIHHLGWWYHLCVWGLITHPLLDLFTTYGTQLFAPFSDARFAIDGVSIIDPLYSIPMGVVVIMGVRKWRPAKHWLWATVTLALTTTYLFLGVAFSHDAQRVAAEQLAEDGFEPVTMRATPTIFNNMLWRVVAKDADDRYAVGFFSTLAREPIRFEFFESETRDPLVARALDSEDGRIFEWFSDDLLLALVEPGEGGAREVVFKDMRYGMISKPLGTPFSATFTFDASGRLLSAKMDPRDRDLDVGLELSLMWRYIVGDR